MKIKLDSALVFSLGTTTIVLLLVLCAVHRYFIYLPKLHEKNKPFLKTCLREVEEMYNHKWLAACTIYNAGVDCLRLPADIVDALNKKRNELERECYEKYPTR